MERMKVMDKIQVKAFLAVFKSSEGPVEDRFVRAVVLTSDDRWLEAQTKPGFRDNLATLLRTMRRGRDGGRKRKGTG